MTSALAHIPKSRNPNLFSGKKDAGFDLARMVSPTDNDPACPVCSRKDFRTLNIRGVDMAHIPVGKTPIRLLRGEILNHWGQLTTEDIEGCVTDRSSLIDILQSRYGYARQRAEKEVDLFLGDFQDRLRLAS
jgi:hypothetical protein